MKSISRFMSKKGQIQSIAPAILILVFASVVLVFGLIMLQELRDTPIVAGGGLEKVNDTAFTAANQTIIGLGTFGDFWEIIVLAIVITVVIGLLLTVFGGRTQR